MKVAIYTRVSTEEQSKDGYSLEVQRDNLISFAKNNGWEKVEVYQDEGISGYTSERPALKKLLRDAKLKRFNIVLVYKIDRFSRRLKDLLNLIDELESYGIGFKSTTEQFDTTNSAGKLMFQQLGSFAEFERNRIAERVFPGMVKGIQRGNWQGARYAPYGYCYNREKKLLEVVNDEAKIVKLIFTMYLYGKSTLKIAGYLYKKGYKTRSGGRFHTKLIGDILKNQIYIGKIVWNKHHYDRKQKTKKGFKYVKNEPEKIIVAQGRHQPIIEKEDFNRVQEMLKIRRKGEKGRSKTGEYLLTGLLVCGNCGHRYVGASNISNHRTGKRKRWYRCSARQTHYVKCNNESVKAEIIEPEVSIILEKIAQNRVVKENRWTSVTRVKTPVFDKKAENDLNNLKNQLENNLRKQAKLSETYLENLIGIEVYREKSSELRRQEEDLKKHIAILELRKIERERSAEYLDLLRGLISDFDDSKNHPNFSFQKDPLKLIFKNIKIAQKRIISFDLFEPFKTLFKNEVNLCQVKATKRLPSVANPSCLLRPTDVR